MKQDGKIKTIFTILFFYIVIEVLVGYYFLQKESNEIANYTSEKIGSQYQDFVNVYQNIENSILSKVFNFNKPEVISILTKANETEDSKELAKLRAELYTSFQPLFLELNQNGIEIFHFHLPNSISFLRMHRPDKFGDSLSKVRASISKSQKNLIFVQGYEGGRIKSGFRNIIPIYNKNRLLGSVEISFSEKKLLQELKQVTNNRYSFILKKSYIDGKVWEEWSDIYSLSGIDKNFVTLRSYENSFLMHNRVAYEHVNTLLSHEIENELLKFQRFSKYIQYEDQDILVSFIPLKDFDGENIGYIVGYKDDTKYEVIRANNSLELYITSLIITLFFIFIYYYISKSQQVKVQRKYFDTIFNTQKDIVVITEGTTLSDANKTFFEFFGFSDIAQFKSKHDCICEYLEKIEKDDFIYKDKYGENWVQTILKNPQVDWKGEIIKNSKKYTFSIEAIYLYFDEEERSLVTFHDITSIIKTKDELEEKVKERTHELVEQKQELEKYRNLVDENIIISSTDMSGIITHVSEAFVKISGYSREELLGSNHNIVRHPNNPKSLYKDMWDLLLAGKVWKGEIRNMNKSKEAYWVKASIYPKYSSSGDISGYTAIRQDITDKKIVEELSVRDPLTGLLNRRNFNSVILEEMRKAKSRNTSFSFIVMDVDNFKKYNDNYGHQNGDAVLKSVARVFKTEIGCEDCYTFRLGGEEFGAIYSGNSRDESLEIADRCRKELENLAILHEHNSGFGVVTGSFGLAFANSVDGVTDHDMYKYADEVLYKAKNSGRNRVEIKEI
jgi:diguanylate cyclase (GGDEF)-like protein/PAS domain S-box-containing protein